MGWPYPSYVHTPHPTQLMPAQLHWAPVPGREEAAHSTSQLGQHSLPLAREEQRGALQAILASNPTFQKVRRELVHTPTTLSYPRLAEKERYSPEQVLGLEGAGMTSGRKHAFSHQLLRQHTRAPAPIFLGLPHAAIHTGVYRPEPAHTLPG